MMDDNQMSVDNILHMIKDGLMSAEEGFSCIKRIQYQQEVNHHSSLTQPALLYQPVWDEQIAVPRLSESRQIIMFDTDDCHWNVLKQNGVRVTLVKPGTSFKCLAEDVYEISPMVEDDYHKLWGALLDRGQEITDIIHWWSKIGQDSNEFENNNHLYHLFFLTKALMKIERQEPIRLLYVFKEQKNKLNSLEAMGGFARTVRCENPDFIYKTFQYTEPVEHIVDQLLEELRSTDKDVEIRCYKGKRQVKQMVLMQKRQQQPSAIPFKKHGTFLISGGLGGLGYIFAVHFAAKFQANLAIVGRSELTSSKREMIHRLESLGAKVLYIRTDIATREGAHEAVKLAKQQFGAVNTVIHAAGVLRDSYIPYKTVQQIREVLEPKVNGTFWLDEATSDETLDYFIMFSSIMAFKGNPGQSDYAFANAYMNSFAVQRESLRKQRARTGKTISVNWTLWEDGGMKVDDATLVFLENTMGIAPLSTLEGIQAFKDVIAAGAPQVAVLKELSDVKIVSKTSVDNQPQEQGTTTTSEDKELYDFICQEIKKLISEILYVDVLKIDLDTDKNEYGFDSISVTDLINRLNKKFGLELTPPLFYEYSDFSAFCSMLRKKYSRQIALVYGQLDSDKKLSPLVQDSISSPSPVNSISNFNNRTFINESYEAEPIAIVGMSGVMPQTADLDELWQQIYHEADLITEVPKDRWDWREYYGDPLKETNKTNIKWGGFMNEVDKFDALFFGISPHEAELMDPRQRIFLETVWKVIEDAGYKTSDLSGSQTGLFVGVGNSDYNDVLIENKTEIQAHTPSGLFNSILTNRISYILNLHGPSEPIDTACSSSLVAVHRAVESIRSGECEMAIAGGINVILSPKLFIALNKAGMLSESGRCHTFDRRADGYVRGEGSAAVMLKPLCRAIEDGDTIHAVIKGSSVNHGGHATSLTAPNPNAQARLIVEAWRKANIDPATAGYIEVHGSGTPLGDPIEINGLKKAFDELYSYWGRDIPAEPHCGIGTIKTNIGHLESAAGIAGLVKVVLCMKQQKLVKNLHYEEHNSYIELNNSPFYIVNQTGDWSRTGKDIPLRAGVSSFGFGGVNAHVVIEEWMNQKKTAEITKQANVICISAKNEDRLHAYVKNILNYLENSDPEISDLFYTLQEGRDEMDERLAVVTDDKQDLIAKLQMYLQHKSATEPIYRGNAKSGSTVLSSLMDGEEGEAFIEHLIKKHKLNKLAKLWVSGMKINWKLLYQCLPNRIPLPVYPFKGERYWISPSTKIDTETSSQYAYENHPLIQRNTSDLSEFRFSSILSGHESYLVHSNEGEFPVFTGGIFLEMACVAVQAITGLQERKLIGQELHIALEDIHWISSVQTNTGPFDIHIGLCPEEDQYINYEIYGGCRTQDEQMVYSQGNGFIGSYLEQNFDIGTLRSQFPQLVELTEQFYKEFYSLQGATFARQELWRIDSLYTGLCGALARLLPTSAESDNFQQFVLHPCLVDLALQTLVWFDGLNQAESKNLQEMVNAFVMHKLTVLQTYPKALWIHIQYTPGRERKTFDINMLDEQGRLCVRMEGLTYN
ncbi:KR domain-containing protein [Paenibacillus polymyxa]|uniref:type I polyketide synthase n=1 Tax=Paenibacillus polymyxa TaxID=1406 RepID=UPI0009BF97D2|nr:type I polyketide synthase [Paenibacillus polymyxa]APB70026.2 KR domain-containing protein [Paenibacillus polymyxa]